MEPLTECFNYLVKYQLAVRVVISDTWMREFQTLPGRMHPNMHMPTSGGYFLSGIYVGVPTQVKVANEIEKTKIYSTPIAYPKGEQTNLDARNHTKYDDEGSDGNDDCHLGCDGDGCNGDEHLAKRQRNVKI